MPAIFKPAARLARLVRLALRLRSLSSARWVLDYENTPALVPLKEA